jgi:uncharacterized protein (DUF1501 family)
MSIQLHTHVRISRRGTVRRRDFLKAGIAAGSLGALGWHDLVAAKADELRQRGMSCILLWMQGGPSQFETFSPKPGHQNGGQTKAISTAVTGVEYAENLPNLAKVAGELAVIRSVTSREGSHPRATSYLHTGYLPTASVKYPAFGALAAKEIEHPECELPAFVQIGRGGFGGGATIGGGFLGNDYNPFTVQQPGQAPANTPIPFGQDRLDRRLDLLDKLQGSYASEGGKKIVEDHQKLYAKTAKMIKSPQMKAFSVGDEKADVLEAYGSGPFASGCLLARRLVETGVTFVEVLSNGWDTHQDNFNRVKQLTGQIDQPFAALVGDLKDRGLLQSTLVIWMGEFGRTPRINGNSGRDHYPRAFNVALAGAGIKGGVVIGQTDEGGNTVTERPVDVTDLFRTFCRALKIDADKENMSPIGRPIRIVEKGGAVEELFT